MSKLFIILLFLSTQALSADEKKYIWLEPGFSWDTNHNKRYLTANISINSAYKYFIVKFDIKEGRDVSLFTDYINKENDKEFERSLKERNLLVGLTHHGSWYRLTSTLGVGYLRVDTPKDCEIRYSSPGFFGNDEYNCKQVTKERLSIPVSITAIIGKYTGFGLQGNATFSTIGNFYSMGFIIPLGRFN